MEKPILFSAPMVNAILEGRKTQTRRIVKPTTPESITLLMYLDLGINADANKSELLNVYPRYRTGDTIWVRETFAHTSQLNLHPSDENYGYVYRADGDPWDEYEGWKWMPSIFMPRDASRISLMVTGVRVERLQDITEEDAISEGVERINYKGIDCWKSYLNTKGFGNARDSFWSLWTKINGKESWDSNPWIWVYNFERVEP